MGRQRVGEFCIADYLRHAVLLVLSGVLLATCGSDQGSDQLSPRAEAPMVNFFNWSDYIADTTLPASSISYFCRWKMKNLCTDPPIRMYSTGTIAAAPWWRCGVT